MNQRNDGSDRPIPSGLQRLLRLAALDDAFLEELVRHRAGVAQAAGISLGPSERAILAAIPGSQLRDMARTLPPPAPPRRDVLGRSAATAVILLGGAALSGGLAGCPPGDGQGTEVAEPAPPPPAVPLAELSGPDAETESASTPRAATLPAIGGVLADLPEECE